MILQGNTYELPIQIKNSSGEILTTENVERVQFVFGEYERYYGEDGDVEFDEERKAFIIKLTEEDTFKLSGIIQWQVRFLFYNGKISGTIPRYENIVKSITQTRIGGETNVI